MSFISDQIKDSGIYDYLVEQVIDELEALEKKEGELKDRIKQLEQELAEAKKDQARYQWLRNEVFIDGEINDSLYVACDSDKYIGRWALVGDQLDSALDAAIKESRK